MSHDKITSLVDSVAKMLADGEKIAVPVLAVRLCKLAEAHPEDKTLLAMSTIVSKLDEHNKVFISKAELKDLYNKSYTNGTKFAEYFKDELGVINNLATPKLASKHETPLETYQVSDSILANALAHAFDKKIALKSYAKDAGDRAMNVVGTNLDSWNLRASNLSIASGNENFIVVKADYDTPKGLTSIFVPVEVSKGKALPPSVFMGNSGPQELNHVNIKYYISTSAGAKLNIKASDVVDVLTSAIADNTDISDVEMALTRINSGKETSSPFFADQVVGQVMQAQVKNAEVTLPKLGEFSTFAEKFESPIGFANFKFGVDKVNLGRDVVVRSLANFGLKNTQVSIAAANDNTIVYAVVAGKTAFNVPVKIANNRVINPEILVCNGSAHPFAAESINELFATNAIDFKAAAVASPSYGLKPSELISNVREAMAEENYAKAEDALNILSQSGDEKAYRIAFSTYMGGLSMTKTASASEPEVTCSMIIKSATSQHPTCGHTSLPLHKVYQDKHGNCHPLYRRGMEESTSGAFFMNSKIFG